MADGKKTILSGIRSTGKLHLGHYFGILENWRKLQDEADCYFMVADLHALTTSYDSTGGMRESIRQIMSDILASGISPDRAVIFLQSLVPEHAELSLLLSMLTPLPWLYRNPTYKEIIAEDRGKDLLTHGFLGYPVLMAADILLYKSDTVPIGQDQLPHLELAREIVRRFNFTYDCEVLVEPQPSFTAAQKLPGTDGRKMSKSYDNCIYLADSAEEVTKRVSAMITDPARVRRNDKGHPEVCSVFAYHQLMNAAEAEGIAADCREAKIGCTDCKKRMACVINTVLEPLRERRAKIERAGGVDDILAAGTKRARQTAAGTMAEVKEAMKLWK